MIAICQEIVFFSPAPTWHQSCFWLFFHLNKLQVSLARADLGLWNSDENFLQRAAVKCCKESAGAFLRFNTML